MRKYNALQKVMALALTLVLVFGLLPNITLPAAAAEGQATLTNTGKVADPSTLNNWQDYYGDYSILPDGNKGISTWKVGGVWTDKSVFNSTQDFVTADGTKASISAVGTNSFLVSLSALASNTEVVGQSSAPTDTMLVLDVSGSMDNNDKAEAMVEAANRAIDALLKQNKNNRVGVMLYSGTRNDDGATATTLLLPLDHYTTTSTVTTGDWYNRETIPAYLNITDDNQSPDVYIASGVRDSNGNAPDDAEREVKGATYIQRGLYEAWKEFETVTDVKVPEGNTQAGTQRTPVMILMSDGRPTLATEDYNNVGLRDSEHGNGSEDTTTHETVFLTQLTAAWVKGAVTDHYGTDMKFYSLGMGTGSDSYATNVLYPSGTTNSDILDWWTSFQSGTNQNSRVLVEDNWGSNNDWYLPYDTDRFATGVGRSYIDRYWSASNVSGMISAFQEIVEEIGIQSAYSATLVEGDSADLGGYITVEDELGAMMEVKDIKGILLGDTLFTGAEMAKSLNSMGTYDDPESLGNQFVRTVKERIGTADTSETQQLIGDAYAAGQLSYTSDTVYSNYIGWYGDKDNKYLGFWQESDGYEGVGAPEGAEYINKSYGYLGAVNAEADAADMMHIVVMVHTEIATGHQTVLFKVPSSLIPMITYKVEVVNEDYTLTVEETDPIRLLYEVGLPDDVNNVNLEQKVAEYMQKSGNHVHKNEETGAYEFYANSWGMQANGTAPVISNLTSTEKQALTESVAESHFIPNTLNERFYIQEDSVLYTYNGSTYVKATGKPVEGNDYYFTRTIYTVTGADGEATAVTQYEKLYPATVANEGNFTQNSDGDWVVKAGTIRQSLSQVGLAKTPENYTDTLPDSDHLWVDITGSTAADHNIYSFLGNNGKLTVAPATGIKVTKDVTEYAEGDTAATKFTIVVTLDKAESGAVVTDANGTVLADEAWDISADFKTVTLYLADGETAYITGLTAGTTYRVSEDPEKYTASYTYENESKTVAAGKVEGVTVTNEPVKNGNLYITKEVKHAIDGETFPTDYEFEFEVTFKDADGNPIANTTFQLENNNDASLTQLTTDENGVMRGKLKHGETTYIKDIPAGTVVTVKEINIPDNYTAEYRSRNATGETADSDGEVTIISDANATVVVTNTYTPTPTDKTNLTAEITKNFTMGSQHTLDQAIEFAFEVQKWNAQAERWETVGTSSVNYAANDTQTEKETSIKILEDVVYTAPGTYSYQIVEKIPDVRVDGLTYDRAVYTLTVTVTDENGQLVAKITDADSNTVSGTYAVTFTNTYDTAPVSIDVKKSVIDTTNNPEITAAGFRFEAYETGSDFVIAENAEPAMVKYSDVAGEARFASAYDEEGTHYFVIKEANAGTSAKGWSYSSAEYHVTVVVTDDGTGNLSAAVNVEAVKAGEGEGVTTTEGDATTAKITFKNTYDPEDAKVPVDLKALVVKKLVGRELKAGEFTFAIFKDGEVEFNADGTISNLTDDAITTATNDVNGNVYFGENGKLTFSEVGTYYYDVVEVKGTLGGVTYDPTIYDLVVEVKDNGDGKLVANYYFEDATTQQITVTNTYTATPTEIVINGLKTIEVQSGTKTLSAGDFTFELYEKVGNVETKVGTTKNLANGTFAFDAIEYDADDVGEHTYVIREVPHENATNGFYQGMTYSTQEFTVKVNVQDNKDGTMTAKLTDDSPAVKFVNTYKAEAAVPVVITGTKTLDGRDLTAGEFKFVLYKTDATFDITGSSASIVKQDGQDYVTNDADGKIEVSTGSLDTLGYHYYVLKEVIPNEEDRAAGIGYDTAEYHITVNVVDLGRGQMTTLTSIYHPGDPNNQNPSVAFKNTYAPVDGQYAISGTKVYHDGPDLTDGAFTFALYEGTTELDTAEVKADGTFTFDAITYTADDIGDHTYTVKEVIPDDATDNGDGTKTSGSIIYDASEFTVVVTVADADKDGALEISHTVTENGTTADLEFTNTYIPTPTEYTLAAEKEYAKGLKGNDFTFTLYDEDGDKIESVQNDADGKVEFSKLTFSKADTYTYTVKETDKIFGFINYSTAEYEVTITVTNNKGALSVTNVVVKDAGDNETDKLKFVNEYKYIDDDDEVTLSGTKTISGYRETVNAGEFSFGLFDENGTPVTDANGDPIVVQNDAVGNFTFPTLTFTKDDLGEKIYTVKEILPVVDGQEVTKYEGRTYDTTVYTVKVTVVDNDEGYVKASYTIHNGDTTVESIAFANKYEVTPATVKLEGTKTYDKGLVGDEFTFTLVSADDKTDIEQTKKNDADGKIVFEELSFSKAGEYKFKVKEEKALWNFIRYSEVVYEVLVTVTDNDKGALEAEVKVNDKTDGEIAFENVYIFDGDDEVTLRGTKAVAGDRTTMAAGEFTFGLYDAEGKLVESVKNDANGNFAFSTMKFDETDVAINGKKEITYTVKEIAGSDPCMTYDETVYTVVVTVKDNDEGGVEATYTVNGASDGKLAFTNTYTAPDPLTVYVNIQKNVVNKTEGAEIGPDGFEFILAQGEEKTTVTSAETGKAVFQLTFDAEDIGKTFEYKVTEKKGKVSGVTYDDAEYTVTIEVAQNADGSLKTIINGKDTNGIALEFTNTYAKPATPITGDSFQLMLMIGLLAVSGAGIAFLLLFKKRGKGGKYAR